MTDKLRILYVDDESSLQEAIKLYLESEGEFAVDTLTSANEAFIRINTVRYDAIVSDYQMPGMDGIEFLKKVRTSGNTIPFILFTGKGREEVVITALNERADFYLQKGGRPEALFAELAHKVKSAALRKMADDALEESEGRHRTILETTRDGFCMIDLVNGKVTEVNKTYCRMTGYTRAEILKLKISDLDVSSTPDEHAAQIKSIIAKGSGILTTRYRRKDGSVFDVELSVTYQNTNGGELIGFCRDITDHKQAEEALHKKTDELNAAYKELTAQDEELRQTIDELSRSEKALQTLNAYNRSLLEAILDPLMTISPEGRITDVNTATERVTGYSRDYLIGTVFLDYFADLEKAREGYLKVFDDGVLQDYSLEIQHKDGKITPVLYNATLYRDESETIWGVIATAHDITDRIKAEKELLKNTEELNAAYENLTATEVELRANFDELTRQELALAESEEKYRALTENTDDIIFSTDMAGIFTYISPQINKYGFLAEEVIGKSLRDLIHPEDIDRVENDLSRDLEKGAQFHTAYRIPDKWGGFDNWFEEKGTLRLDPSGKPIGIYGMNRDITERKVAEEALMKSEEALLQSNKKLTLLSSITRHDINNQLTVILGYMDMLECKGHDPTLDEYFQTVSTAAHRIAGMIRFTKEYESIGVNAPTWQDCHTLVDTAAKEAPLGKVMVKNDFPAGAEVFADPLVVKVFYNLMDNAVRYGGKITTIRFSVEEAGDCHLIVCEDDGDGVVAVEKEKIFERGFGKNTGLGLALSREILSITGITIKETGEPGKGARFEMTVPKGIWRTKGDGA
jgi:PAS domain S-box-containing protein